MDEPGDRRPAGTASPGEHGTNPAGRRARTKLRSLPVAMVLAILIALVAALAWGVLRVIFDLGVGLLAVAAIGGWGIGAVLRQAAASPALAGGIGAIAWAAGLVLTWAVAMAIIQESARTFLERLEAFAFSDYMAPQFGLFEIAGLLVYVGASVYGARRPST